MEPEDPADEERGECYGHGCGCCEPGPARADSRAASPDARISSVTVTRLPQGWSSRQRVTASATAAVTSAGAGSSSRMSMAMSRATKAAPSTVWGGCGSRGLGRRPAVTPRQGWRPSGAVRPVRRASRRLWHTTLPRGAGSWPQLRTCARRRTGRTSGAARSRFAPSGSVAISLLITTVAAFATAAQSSVTGFGGVVPAPPRPPCPTRR